MTQTFSNLWSADLSQEGSPEGSVCCRCHKKKIRLDQAVYGSMGPFQSPDFWCIEMKKNPKFQVFDLKHGGPEDF